MKVGDKVYCHTSYLSDFRMGRLYIVNEIDGDIIGIRDEYAISHSYFHIPNDQYRPMCDYFYTMVELRKMKLKRIISNSKVI